MVTGTYLLCSAFLFCFVLFCFVCFCFFVVASSRRLLQRNLLAFGQLSRAILAAKGKLRLQMSMHADVYALLPPTRCHTARHPTCSSYRHRNVAKLLYIHMLGYPSQFGQVMGSPASSARNPNPDPNPTVAARWRCSSSSRAPTSQRSA